MAGRPYANAFGLDVAFGDALTGPPEIHTSSGFLEFAGIAPVSMRLYPRPTHIAEKFHAYTMPRPRENSRVRDLPDIALLATSGGFAAQALDKALQSTFVFRNTHALPTQVPSPPSTWKGPYEQLVSEFSLPWKTLEEVTEAVRIFLTPVLEGVSGRWDPVQWVWRVEE